MKPFKPDTIATFAPAAEGLLLDYLLTSMPERSRTTVKQMLGHRQVRVNGMITTRFDHPVGPGDKVEVNFTREFREFRHRRVRLVYEDDDIIVVEKGYGLLSVSTDKVREGTAYSIVRDYIKWQNPANKLFIVHRLDRDTSGLMVFAKNIEAKEALQHNWNNMVLSRKYVAVVEGIPEKREDTITSYLAENAGYEVYSTDNPSEGKLAVTRYRTLRTGHGHALLEVELDTGRKNQIRVHLKEMGHPILGDRKYGAKSSAAHRLCLHAQTLRFVHPVTRRILDFTTPIPAPLLRLL